MPRTLPILLVALAALSSACQKTYIERSEGVPSGLEPNEVPAAIASAGMEHVAAETTTPGHEVIERGTLEYLFRVGTSLDPESARPDWLANVSAQDEDDSE